MPSLNRAFLIGALVRDPELRYTPKAVAVATIGLAINRYRIDDEGRKSEETTFVDVALWGRLAEVALKYLHRGHQARLMRQARIRQRAIPQLQTALEANEITLYRAGEIAKLPLHQQEIAVAQWRTRSLLRMQGQAIAATVIREELTRGSCNSKIDLALVASAIKRAITNSNFDCDATER
jgi:hypothetical protein